MKYLFGFYNPNTNNTSIPDGYFSPAFKGKNPEQQPTENPKATSEESLKIASDAASAAGIAGIEISKGKRQHVSSITKEDIQSCLDKNMTPKEICKELGISIATYYKLCHRFEISTHELPSRVNASKITAEDIQSLLDKNMSSVQIQKELGISRPTYQKLCHKFGIFTPNTAARENVSKITAEDIQSRLDKNMSAAQIQKELGISKFTYQRLCHKFEITTRMTAALENSSKITAEDIQSRLDNNMTAAEIIKELRVSLDTYYNLCRKFGINTRMSAARENVSNITSEDIQSRLDKNMTAVEIQKELGISRTTYQNLCNKYDISTHQLAALKKVSKITKEDIQSRLDKNMSAEEIRKEFGISCGTYCKLCRKFGIITPQVEANKKINKITKDDIQSRLNNGMGCLEICDELGISNGTYSRLCQKFGISTQLSATIENTAQITKEDIQSRLDKNMSAAQIQKELGISATIYQTLCHKFGITTPMLSALERVSKITKDDIQSRLDENMSGTKIQKELGISKPTYRRLCYKFGIIKPGAADHKNVYGVTAEDIQSLLDKNMTAGEIQKELGISKDVYYKLCNKYRIATQRSATFENTAKITAEDIQSRLDKNMSAAQIQKELGISKFTYQNLCHKFKISTPLTAARENISKITVEDFQSLLDKNMSAAEIQKELGISDTTYRKLCHKYGIVTREFAERENARKITAKDIQSRLDNGMGYFKICDELGISVGTYSRLCYKLGIKTNQMERINRNRSISKEELSALLEQGYKVSTICEMLNISQTTYDRFIQKFKISTKRSEAVEHISKITKSDLENLLKEMSPYDASKVLNISKSSIYRLMLKYKIHPSQRELPERFKDYSDEQLRSSLLNQYINNAELSSNEVFEDVVDFALGENYSEETREKVINLIKLFNKVNTNSESIENALHSDEMQDLYSWMQQEADFKQMQKEQFESVQKCMQDIIYNSSDKNKRLAGIAGKYIPHSIDDDNYVKAEFILETLNEADTPENAEKKLAYWDLKNSPNGILKQAEQYARNKDGIIDDVKAGEYILCVEEFNKVLNSISDEKHKMYTELVKDRLISNGKNNYTDAYKILNIYDEAPEPFKGILLCAAQKYDKNDYIFINELTALDEKIKFCNIDKPTEFEFYHKPSGKVKKGAISPKAKQECWQYCAENYNQNAFDRFYKFMDKFYQSATIWAPRKFGSSGIKDIEDKQTVYSEIKIKGGSEFDDWRLFATGEKTLGKDLDKRYIFDAFGNHDWLIERK